VVWHELVLAVFLFSDMAQFEYKLSKLRRDQLQSGANLHKSVAAARGGVLLLRHLME